MTAPAAAPVPACLHGLVVDQEILCTSVQATALLLQSLERRGVPPGDRLLILTTALAHEILHTGRGEETETLAYLAGLLGRLVGLEIGNRVVLETLPSAGRC